MTCGSTAGRVAQAGRRGRQEGGRAVSITGRQADRQAGKGVLGGDAACQQHKLPIQHLPGAQ